MSAAADGLGLRLADATGELLLETREYGDLNRPDWAVRVALVEDGSLAALKQ